MNRYLQGIFIIAAMLFTSGCATTAPRHMVFKDDPAPKIGAIRPESGKAALVVARTTSFGGAIEFDTYLDRKMIGVTQWKSYFVKTDISPGAHYVISKAENAEPALIAFEPDRVYFLHQIPRMGVWRARISVALVTPDELVKTFDDGVRLVVYNPEDEGEDLSDEDFNQAVKDYEREVNEGLHKEDALYKGVLAR